MRLEGEAGVFLVVFAADGEDDASAGEGEAVTLEGEIGFADGAALAEDDSVEAVVADDSAPEGVVEVEDEALG